MAGFDLSRAALTTAETRAAAATARAEGALAEQTQSEQARASAITELDRALGASDLTPADLDALFAVPPETVEALRGKLRALDDAVTSARATLTSRRQDHQSALADGLPEYPPEAIAEKLAELEALATSRAQRMGIRIFCEEYAAERNRLQAARSAGRADLEKELTRVSTDHKKLVDAILAGVPADQVKDRMIEIDARRKDLERQLSTSPAPDPIRIHPGMARTYRARIGQLIIGLQDAERMDEAKEALRALIEKVELVPVSAEESAAGKPGDSSKPRLAIHLHGALASLLRLACGLPVHEVVGAAAQTQKAPRKAGRLASNSSHSADADMQAIDISSELVLVAGASYRRNLPKLRCAV